MAPGGWSSDIVLSLNKDKKIRQKTWQMGPACGAPLMQQRQQIEHGINPEKKLETHQHFKNRYV